MRMRVMLGIVGGLLAGCVSVSTVQPMPDAKRSLNAAQLSNTLVTPVLDAPIPDGVNVVWCASFQLAWNELPDVTMRDPMYASLNQPVVRKADVNDANVVASAGTDGPSLKQQIRRELAAKFGDAANTPLLEQWQPTPGVSFYAYMRMSMPFEYAFDAMEPISILTVSGGGEAGSLRTDERYFATFGLAGYNWDDPGMQKLGRQVRIIWHEFGNEDDPTQHFVIELKTKSPVYRLLLAKLPPQRTLDQAVAAVRAKSVHPNQLTAAEYKKQRMALKSDDAEHKLSMKELKAIFARVSQLSELWVLEWVQIPVLDFDLAKQYEELAGVQTSAGPITQAMQRIRFKLDRTGAALESEAAGSIFGMEPRKFVCEPPYLLLIVSAKSDKPVLACWIANSELLTPVQPPRVEESSGDRIFEDSKP